MKGWDKRRRQIKEELISRTGKRALLVEGPDDESLFRIFLSRKFGPEWENTWVLTSAGNKKIITDILVQENGWLGIVDRDEWREEVIDEKQDELGNLFVLPRFCLESYAIDPGELWQALPEGMQVRVDGGFETLENEILHIKDQWLRHGVLWSAINPLWSGLRALGFKEKLLDFDVVQDDNIIRETLKKWHGYLDPDLIYQSFADKLNQVSGLSVEEQLHKWIHGKQFFLKHVHPILNRYLGQSDAQIRIIEIFRSLALPEDLEPLWARIQPE